jgi:hypothetical protein
MASLLFAAAAMLLAASTPAEAHGRGHPRARVGVYIGAPVVLGAWGWHRPPPSHYYYPPTYYYPQPPVVIREIVREPLVYYDERGNALPPGHHRTQPPAPAQPQPGSEAPTWFFCADTQSYFPYVQNCASPWQRVVPQPPPAPQ